jgi:hypothetical protein
MQALKLKKEVVDGKIVLKVPKNFGAIVEVIILGRLDGEIEFWNEDEIKDLGKTGTLHADFDKEDYSRW